jgi:hypothetical protein
MMTPTVCLHMILMLQYYMYFNNYNTFYLGNWAKNLLLDRKPKYQFAFFDSKILKFYSTHIFKEICLQYYFMLHNTSSFQISYIVKNLKMAPRAETCS